MCMSPYSKVAQMCLIVKAIVIVNVIRSYFLSESLSHYIVNCYSKCDKVENQSDHASIDLELDIPIDHHVHVAYLEIKKHVKIEYCQQ